MISLDAWWDASDMFTLTISAGAVSQWNDKSGNANHLTQATGAKQPSIGRTLNGRNAVEFFAASADTDMDMTSAINLLGKTALVAGVKDSTNNCAFFGNSGINVQFLNTNANDMYYNSTATYWSPGAAITGSASDYSGNGNPNIFGYVFNATNIKSAVNGTVRTGNAGDGSGNTTVDQIGDTNLASQNWDGLFGEIIILPDEDDTRRILCEGYLAHKWGSAVYLSADHPYRYHPPRR
jgi:hypothetical protein